MVVGYQNEFTEFYSLANQLIEHFSDIRRYRMIMIMIQFLFSSVLLSDRKIFN